MHYRRYLLGTLLAILALTANPALGVGPNVANATGHFPRNLAQGSFDISVVVENILPSDMTPTTTEGELWARIKIFLIKLDDDTEVPHTVDLNGEFGYYLQQRANYSTVTNTDGNNDVTFYLRVFATNKANGLQKLLDKEGAEQVSIAVEYHGGTGKSDTQGNDFIIKRATGVANAAPDTFTVESTHKGVTVKWDYADSIAYKGGAAGEPSGAVVYALPNNQTVSIPARVYNVNPASETDTTCTFTPIADSGEACISCGTHAGNAYFNLSRLNEIPSLRYVGTAAGLASIGNLDIDQEYAVFIAYEPDGVMHSSCEISTASKNYSYAETEGEKEAELRDPRCFIATAAYGRADDRQVLALRWFRGHVLQQLPFGAPLVRSYYRVSPPIARFIANSPLLRLGTRLLLAPLVGVAEILRWFMEPTAA